MLVLTFTTFFFGGFAREQICIYACPWPRIQAAMLDEDTLTIGLPRLAGRAARQAAQAARWPSRATASTAWPASTSARWGSTSATASSWPASPAALCIDACNDMMDKIGKPRDLIGYLALTDETARARRANPPKSVWTHVFRAAHHPLHRALGRGRHRRLSWRCSCARDIDMNVTPVRNPTFVTLSDGVDPQRL